MHWQDVTLIEEGSNDELVFTESVSPSESLMGKTVSIDVPKVLTRNRSKSLRASRSAPPPRGATVTDNTPRLGEGTSYNAMTARSFIPELMS